jgi:signal transduction histidine kinase
MKLNRLLQTVQLPDLTVRWRLTLLYSLIFLVCAAALLALTYGLFANFAYSPPKQPLNAVMYRVQQAMSVQRSNGLHRLQTYSEIGLAFMAFVSVGLGWVMAGRVLAPLRTITAAADRISDANLHERIELSGPQDELRRLADTIDRLLGRLEVAFKAQRRFVANASHELRTPLATMRTTLDVAMAKPAGVPEQTRELDAELRVDLDQVDRLLESFLSLARAQDGRLAEERSQVALDPLISAALAARADELAGRHLSVGTHLTPIEVSGSETLLERMIENVIENAVRHIEPGGSIEVALEPFQGEHGRLTVDSSGPILDQNAVAQLTQPFRRLGHDRIGSHSGHGLGLSIVAAVAAAHGGNLRLQARLEGGLRVQITLPASTIPQFAETTR